MIKLVCFLRRNPALSREAFHDHWLHRHGPLIAETPELARHLVRYDQNHRVDWDYERDDPDAPGFDGATVQWMESMHSFAAFVREPKYAESIRPDEAQLLDMSSIALLFTHEEDVILDGSVDEADLKLCALLKRKPGSDAAAFRAHWRGVHGDLFARQDDLARHVLAYHQNRRLERDYQRDGGGGFDGMAEQWYRDREAFQAMLAEQAYADVQRDERGFLDPQATQYLLVRRPDRIL